MFASRTDILVKKTNNFLQHRCGKMGSVLDFFLPLNFLKNLISTIWDRFYGGASPSYDIFFSVTDGQNANTKLITLSNEGGRGAIFAESQNPPCPSDTKPQGTRKRWRYQAFRLVIEYRERWWPVFHKFIPSWPCLSISSPILNVTQGFPR